jgi:OOP family OmpA-OmpF porin
MPRIHHIAAAALLAAGACAASAADFYVGGSVGSSRYHADDDVANGFTVNDKNDTGYKLFGGVSITENFGVEAGYVNLGKLKFTDTSFGPAVSGTIKGTGFFVDAVGTLPLGSSGFAVLGKIGVFNGKAKATATGPLGSGSADDSGTDVKFGIGASYTITKSLQVRAEWERYRFNIDGDKGDTDLLSVGLTYKF